MKFINKTTVIAALAGGVTAIALAVGGVAFAHGGPHGDHRGKGGPWSPEKVDEHLTEMTERLDLSSEQQANIRAVMEQAATQGQAVKDMPWGQDKFEAMKDLRFATEDQIHANLTCAQREELRLLMREHKADRMQRRFERHDSETSE